MIDAPGWRLRSLVDAGDRPVALVGAHNAVAARLIQDRGFDGVWVSSLEMSAVHGVEDANLIGVREVASAVHYMANACTAPIVVDADNGYGSVAATMRAAREYKAAGAAGLCIEDASYPKRNSFEPGVVPLVDPAEHCERIVAARSVTDPEFVLIARTEALIRGRSVYEAIDRGERYAAAGADLVLIHSKDATAAEAREVARRWQGAAPLVTVPTAFAHVPPAALHEAGYAVVIYANQLLRAAIHGMARMLDALASGGGPIDEAVDMSDVLELLQRFSRPAPAPHRVG